jgi:hypothetical protein
MSVTTTRKLKYPGTCTLVTLDIKAKVHRTRLLGDSNKSEPYPEIKQVRPPVLLALSPGVCGHPLSLLP